MTACLSVMCVRAYAQTDTIRYVKEDGKFSNDGRSWETATNKLQDAINDLRDYLRANNLSSGSVYVAAGTYVPTESTESTGGSMLNTSFKVYAGIHIYGGFNPDAPESKPGDRIMENDKKCSENWADPSGIGTTSGDSISSQWELKYKTILSGNHSSSEVKFVFDSIRGRYNTTYPANSYHVVWFATNGQYTGAGVDEATAGHFRPLERPASLDGCVITSGNASSRNTTTREHTAYGGGVYMVGNSYLRNCTIDRCNATLRGGGIYADGGGNIEFCYIHTCQCNGVGVVEGYGGGVCIEHEGSIGHSHITNCAARCGGGLLICHVPEEFPHVDEISFYSPFATACVINNNTANAEGGGIYLAEGGTINHCTVTANNCCGPDVTYYGRRHGRSGGIYVRNCGMIFNSVFWGNRCDANNDIQFATARQKIDQDHEIFAYHSAFMNHDITDWTGVTKEMVFSLEKQNLPKKGSVANFPCFFYPTVDPENWHLLDLPHGYHGAGVFQHLSDTYTIPGPRIWHLTSYSALDQKGVQVTDAVQDVSPWIRHAHTDYGVVTNPFEPASTLGALVRQPDPMEFALIAPQGQEGRKGSTPIPTLFVDPNRPGVYDSQGKFVAQDSEGESWDTPIKDLGEALSFFRKYLVDSVPGDHHYMIPAPDPATGLPVGEPTRYDFVQILVKEGTLTTAGPGNYLNRDIRTAAARVESHMRLYGGYPTSLTGTDTSKRNPRDYVTNITSNITRISGTKGYENNSAHVMALVNTEKVVIDGFKLSDANTHNVDLTGSVKAGGGILLTNSSTSKAKRINMVGNHLRNCVITNCTAPKGAAIYVNGEHLGPNDTICYAELMMMNCVIRNNKADYKTSGSTVTESHGVITANGRAYVHIEHCDIVNNVGYPFKADSKTTDTDAPIYCNHEEHNYEAIYHGYIRVDNSIIFCNGDSVVDDRGQLGGISKVTSVNPEGQEYVFGMYNMFDADLVLHQADYSQPHGFFQNGYTIPSIEHFMPDGVSSHFIDDISDVPADSLSRNNKCILTRANSADPNYPTFLNPSRNVGNSPSGDRPLYGGNVSYAPMTTNPCVNAAYSDYYTDEDNYDRTDNCTRTRGGAPDIGALENADLPAAGTVLYVTPDGAGKMDGSSWSNAIAGNTVYRLYGAPAADGDSIDTNNGARLVSLSGQPVLTTDNRYCGGFSQKYIYPVFTDRGRNISRTIEINKYIGGDNPRIDTVSVDTTANTLITGYKYNDGTIPSSFVSTKAPDPKYPYGEMSGASRYTYRAAYNYSPLTEDAKGVMLDGSVPVNAAEVVNSGRLILRNERTENYVSGLQYAVEKASMQNKTLHKDTVQVWVGAGKYTDYKGYVMRDSVSVYGGFPVGKYPAPSMAERKALMSNVVAIPKSAENVDLDAADYETILQISDVNPKSNNTAINTAAIKFTDDSATVKVNILNNVTKLSDHHTINYYRWQPGSDVSTSYIRYPDMLYSGTKNVFSTENPSCRHKTDKTGVSTEGGWSWISGEKYVYQYWGDKGGGNNSWELVYANRKNNVDYNSFMFNGDHDVVNADGSVIGIVPRGMELTGGMSKMSAWQTMKNVPAGEYQLEIDLAAFYHQTGDGHGYDVENENTGVTFYILASNGDTVANQPIFVKNTTTPYKLRRYTFNFEQPANGDLTVRLMAAPGTKTTDPAALNSDFPAMNENLNRREVLMANVHLYSLDIGQYVLDRTEEEDVESKTINSTSISEEIVSGTKRNRAVLRKRVLQMPDVTATTYIHSLGYPTASAGGKYADNLQHYERLIKDGRLSNVKADGSIINGRHQDPNYKEYNKVYWDGFTIRHGFIYNQRMAHGGGAGVCMYEGATLSNCIVTDNWAGAGGIKGGGVFCDGSTSTIQNCFILNNTSTQGTGVSNNTQGQQQGGGLFLYEGTCFNTLIANNHANGPGGALGLCVAKFYNNTLAYNSSNNGVGGVRVAVGSEPAILMANTIIFGNTGKALSVTSGTAAVAPFINCYIQSATQLTANAEGNFIKALTDHVDGVTDGNFGIKNTFLNKVNPNATNTPFAADIVNGAYNSSNPGAKANNDFALRQVTGIKCINSGEEDFESAMYAGVRAYLQRNNASLNPTDENIKKETFYKNVVGVKLPSNDVVYAKRIQDCQVDIGAYEFNAAYNIKPDTITHPGKAIYYASFDSPGGDASACSPANAACSQKFQLVLDAAGRYKYNLMKERTYSTPLPSTPVAGQPDSTWTVEVWLEGDSANATVNGEYKQWYTPTRSTKHSVENYHDNSLDYSFIIPRGIYVKGGYKEGYYHYENADGDTVVNNAGVVLEDTTGMNYHIVDDRDPLTYRSVFSGKVVSSTGAEGQCYHVVTFTKDLFDANEKVMDNGNQLDSICGKETAELHRAVIDGMFIEDGYANAPDDNDRIGAGAVVTDYAHVRNCVVQNNEAEANGGGLYLKPFALVSGTILKKNIANQGGGIYVESPLASGAAVKVDSLARIYSTTICQNEAEQSAGGLWFDNTYARVNSTVLWQNTANDNANVAGSFTRSNDDSGYPFSYCAVESRRLEGQGNLELSPRETEGVRWDPDDPFKAILYYSISMSSTLSRAGMTYDEWYKAQRLYPTLDSTDIAGVSRTKWSLNGIVRGFAWGSDTLVTKSNAFIEIGARALNKTFEIKVDEKYVMRRLFVMHTEYLNTEAAYALQQNTYDNDTSNMYRQMGSCILNPFHRLGDALDYIIAARKTDPEKYRNARFEVYLEQGTYYPFHNALGTQDHVRTNTFLIPEATTLIGGVHSQMANHNYCQAGYVDPFTRTVIPGSGDGTGNVIVHLSSGDSITLNYAPTDSIRMRGPNNRPMRDNNLNSVIEPWELERQTILSGNAVAGEDFTHVYHVVTIHADSTVVGPQPIKYRTANGYTLSNPIAMNDKDHFEEECKTSILARTVQLDGIQITGGYANHLDTVDTIGNYYRTKTYYRGGGILIDGNWTEAYNQTATGIPEVATPAKYNIPILIQNCVFNDNMAGLGGALYTNGGLYLTSSQFTQNYSQGPMTEFDQQYMPISMGGCIASNATSDISNTLFANNEARRGKFPITINSGDAVPDAEARQGFGGAVVISQTGRMRAVNCHFVRNKGIAYSAIYNFLANNHYQDPDSMQLAVNTLFWGNEVFNVDSASGVIDGGGNEYAAIEGDALRAFNTKYRKSQAGVFHYDGDVWDRYEKLYHEYDSTYAYWTSMDRGEARDTFAAPVMEKLKALRAVGDSMEGMFFCSYRKGYGPTGMRPTKDGFLLTKAEQRAFVDPRETPMLRLKDGAYGEYYDTLFSYLRGNNNVLINPINNATDGPNFKQPTFVAGIDGYMQNADWLLSRMNVTTDQGWGHLKQKVERGIAYYITKYTGTDQFSTPEAALAAAKVIEPSATAEDVYPISGLPVAKFEHDTLQPANPAIYNYYAKVYNAFTGMSNPALPIGDQYYMNYTRGTSDSETSGVMNRISKNPKMGETDVHIDIGIYEYQYVQLDIKGQEIDTMWVATKEKGAAHDGISWESPTTDLQYAIDMLMSSHNNHDKYVCFLGSEDETFSPQNVIDNRRAFIISSGSLSPLLPDSAMADYDYGIRSLNFLGGYNYDVKDAQRDPYKNPVVVEMPNIGTQSQRNQLFIVEDMTRLMLQANFQGESTARDSVVIPITFDGITFINPYGTKDPASESYTSLGGSMTKQGGAAIYYRWQRQYDDIGGVIQPNFNLALHPDSALIDGRKQVLPKLTISSCQFMDNGEWTTNVNERSPAVFIGYGGGGSLIVNSVFHSNAGAPIFARNVDHIESGETNFEQVHNPAVIVNSTFALNGGHLRLGCEGSEVHNSIIWKDDLANDTTTQLQIGTLGETGDDYWVWDKNENKNRVGVADHMTYNAVWGCFTEGDETYHNENLSSDNYNILTGPNFMTPIDTATTSASRRARDFRLNPGLRTMNAADTTLYRNKVFFREYPSEAGAEVRYWRRPNGFKSFYITSLAKDSDYAAKPRLSGLGLERGAFECQAVLQRVLYVDPTTPFSMAGDGSSWRTPLGQGQLQNAINAAAVYTYMSRNASPETQKAYVFVKGSGDSNEGQNIQPQDGVSVFGSLPGSFNDTAWVNPDSAGYTNGECHRFVNYVRSYVSGVASPNASPTRISTISAAERNFNLGFLLEGFVITNPGDTLHAAPVVLNSDHTTIRNCIITNNKVDNGAPVVDLQNGLLYNTLIYNDSASALVRVGEHGLVLNNTIVADKDGVLPIDDTNAETGAVQNNIAFSTQSTDRYCFAPYMTTNTPFALPSYLTSTPALAYQLHECSKQINAGSNTLPAVFDTHIADSVICFWRDRDILGNPRKIGGTVDNGAFETWRVEPSTDVEVTALTNEIILETEIKTRGYADLKASFKHNYGGNAYPHPGSVVYLMDSSSMTMHHENQDFHNMYFRPGYMLLKSGASFYGNGKDVQMNYLAAEKRFINQRYSMTAFPFDYYTDHITSTSYNAAKDSLTAHLSPLTFNTYQYSGAARSAKDYVFQTNNSSLWLPIDTLHRSATEGYLMDFGASMDTVLRFTAFGARSDDYIYTENDLDKFVDLTQYDHRQAGQGQELNFTRQEDMGWNMKGLPWLVSYYRTDTTLEGENYLRQMYIPHVIYQMDGAGEYIHNGGQIYTARSWDKGTTMSMGNAFLTQTATTKDKETIVFHLPYYGRNKRAARPLVLLSAQSSGGAGMPARYQSSITNHLSPIATDLLTVIPDSTAEKTIKYSYGRDGMKWISDAQEPQIYMLDSKRLSRISLLGSAPTEVDIPLGVSIPTDMQNETFRFEIPEKEAFADYAYVWVIDHKYNRTINLLEQDYETEIEAGVDNTRFALRIGGFPLTDDKGKRQYIVFTYNRSLFIRGLIAGDKIDIYSPAGQIIYSTTANTSEWTMPLFYQSGYVVKVNDRPYKVLNQ